MGIKTTLRKCEQGDTVWVLFEADTEEEIDWILSEFEQWIVHKVFGNDSEL